MAMARLGTLLRQIRALTACAAGAHRPDDDLLATFLAQQSPRAFEAIIHRHGPMVLSMGVRVLGNVDDAEDVFQATFLLLAQQAESIRKRGSLASWLHGVAYRMATNARRAAARRRKHEANAAAGIVQRNQVDAHAAFKELQRALDREIAALPAIYREVFVRACLEHQSS